MRLLECQPGDQRAKLARSLYLQKYNDKYYKKSKNDPLPRTIRAALKADSFCLTKINHHRNNLHCLCHQSYSHPDLLHQNQYQITPYHSWGITQTTHDCFFSHIAGEWVHNASKYEVVVTIHTYGFMVLWWGSWQSET